MTFSGLQLSTTVDEFPETEAPMVGEEMILFLAPSETDSGKVRLSGNAFGAFRIIEGKVMALTNTAAVRRGDREQSVMVFERDVSRLLAK
jgi:hypothetical protein